MKKMMVTMLVLLLASSGVMAGDDGVKYPFVGYPMGYKLKGDAKDAVSVIEIDDGKALQFKSDKITKIRLRSSFFDLKPKTKYMLSYQVKVTNFKTKKGKHPDGVMVQLRSKTGKPYTWINVSGNGETDEWVTANIAFDTGDKPAYCKSRLAIYFNNISGTVLLRNLKIKVVSGDDFQVGRFFTIGEDRVNKAVLKL